MKSFDENKEDEEITKKIPIDTFCKINNAPIVFDTPTSTVRFVLLKAKSAFISYFGNIIYAVQIKSETETAWIGLSIKNPSIGLIKWDKTQWDKIYGFTLSLNMQEDVI